MHDKISRWLNRLASMLLTLHMATFVREDGMWCVAVAFGAKRFIVGSTSSRARLECRSRSSSTGFMAVVSTLFMTPRPSVRSWAV